MSWYVDFFASGDYARLYSFDPERSTREADFVRSILSGRLLDLCCGTGRHLRDSIGVDLNLPSLRGLRAACAEMRSLPFRKHAFDGAYSLFSSFGYLESDDEDLRVLSELHRVLKPGGRLLIDLLNRDYALAGFVANVQTPHEDGSLIVERRAWDPLRGRLTTRFVIIDSQGQQRESIGHSLRLYAWTELARLLQLAGFEIEETFGGYNREPFDLESVRMITSARSR